MSALEGTVIVPFTLASNYDPVKFYRYYTSWNYDKLILLYMADPTDFVLINTLSNNIGTQFYYSYDSPGNVLETKNYIIPTLISQFDSISNDYLKELGIGNYIYGPRQLLANELRASYNSADLFEEYCPVNRLTFQLESQTRYKEVIRYITRIINGQCSIGKELEVQSDYLDNIMFMHFQLQDNPKVMYFPIKYGESRIKMPPEERINGLKRANAIILKHYSFDKITLINESNIFAPFDNQTEWNYKATDLEVILMPSNVSSHGVHWVLLVYYIKINKLFVYDPMSSNPQLSSLKKFLYDSGLFTEAFIKNKRRFNQQVSDEMSRYYSQGDSTTACGLYVLFLMKLHLKWISAHINSGTEKLTPIPLEYLNEQFEYNENDNRDPVKDTCCDIILKAKYMTELRLWELGDSMYDALFTDNVFKELRLYSKHLLIHQVGVESNYLLTVDNSLIAITDNSPIWAMPLDYSI